MHPVPGPYALSARAPRRPGQHIRAARPLIFPSAGGRPATGRPNGFASRPARGNPNICTGPQSPQAGGSAAGPPSRHLAARPVPVPGGGALLHRPAVSTSVLIQIRATPTTHPRLQPLHGVHPPSGIKPGPTTWRSLPLRYRRGLSRPREWTPAAHPSPQSIGQGPPLPTIKKCLDTSIQRLYIRSMTHSTPRKPALSKFAICTACGAQLASRAREKMPDCPICGTAPTLTTDLPRDNFHTAAFLWCRHCKFACSTLFALGTSCPACCAPGMIRYNPGEIL